MKTILKHIMTRPVLLPAMVGWFIGVGSYLEKKYGIGMKEHFIYYRDGVAWSYRSQRQLAKVRRYIIKHPALVLKSLDTAKDIYKRFIAQAKALNRTELLRHPEILKSFFENYLVSWAPNFFAFWTPQLVKRKELGKYGQEVFTVSAEVRRYLDPLVFATQFFQRVIKLINKDKNLLKHCTNDELYKYLTRTLTQPERKKIAERPHGWLIYENKSWYVSDFEEMEKIVNRYGFSLERNTEINKNIRSLTGTVAFPGKAQGRVRLLFKYEDNQKVKRGDIIISPMTTPAFMPAIIKCAGIVTDEGSITCHAAIVARELKKPCIVSTKIATKVFKDGDRVEVNAIKGVIRKM